MSAKKKESADCDFCDESVERCAHCSTLANAQDVETEEAGLL